MLQHATPSNLELSLFWYFLSINLVYTFLLVLGAYGIYKRRKELSVEDFSTILHSNALPEIAFIVPMYNEEKNIVNCLKSIINLSYRYKKMICVNDGSLDKTLDVLIDELDLVKVPSFIISHIDTAAIKQIYRSRKNPEIIVIDKEHKGKFDTVNVGINACSSPYFIAVDADTFIDDIGFEAMVRPILAYPETVAVGGTVRIKNGCTLDYNRVVTKKLSYNILTVFQGLEYLRSFLQRQGWNYVGGNFVIAGAFSIFPTEMIRKTGGFGSSIAEDMEIIVRLHHLMKDEKKKYRIFYLPDPVAWTEGPSTLSRLAKQRINWHWGLLETLYFHKKMCLNPRYGFFGIFNYPFWIWGEAIEPIAEAMGYLLVITAWLFGFLNTSFFLLLFLVTLGFTFIYSLVCLLIEELSFKKYSSLKTVLMMFLLSLVENLGYRQLMIYWRIKAFFKFFKNYAQTKKESERLNRLIKKFTS
jgi:cellulose synthase/poly-beta-1,6-N-acetylglucosamine synthase-like glycosyltransferase